MRSSWLALAMKSARMRSMRRASLWSLKTSTNRGRLPWPIAGRGARDRPVRSAPARHSRRRPKRRAPDSMLSIKSCISGARNFSCSDMPGAIAPKAATAAALAWTTVPSRSKMISGSATAAARLARRQPVEPALPRSPPAAAADWRRAAARQQRDRNEREAPQSRPARRTVGRPPECRDSRRAASDDRRPADARTCSAAGAGLQAHRQPVPCHRRPSRDCARPGMRSAGRIRAGSDNDFTACLKSQFSIAAACSKAIVA